jgi:hypothetical protein
MRIPSITSISHGSASIMHLRKLENGYSRALDRSKEHEDAVYLEEMSHSERMEFLKHDGALRQLQQDKERADLAKAEVTRVLERVRSIRKDIQGLYSLQLKIGNCLNIVKKQAMGINLHNQQIGLRDTIWDLTDSLQTSDFYNGSLNRIGLSGGHSVNSSFPILGSTLKMLEFLGNSVVGSGFSFDDRLRFLDLFLIPYLSQDMETCDRAHEVIDAEITMHTSILSKFHVKQKERDVRLADAENRLNSFFMFLWSQMMWSREMTKMMHGMS